MRALVLIFALFGLTACGNVAITQDRGDARILVGSIGASEQHKPAEIVAPLFAQYAWLATRAYDDALYKLGTEHKVERDACDPGEDCSQYEKRISQLRAIWGTKPLLQLINDCSDPARGANRRDFGHDGGPGSCSENPPDRSRILDGLGVQVWRRQSDPCGEFVIAFRGTDFKQSDDWLSNFRWVTRVMPLYDQYEQVRDHVNGIVDKAVRKAGCVPRQITAIGHSLGGGLAQQAAYAQKPRKDRASISRVYAFDPSFVTGYYNHRIDRDEREIAVKSLKIDRVYEHGEVLAYPRFFLRHIYEPSACSPQVRLVRFNFLDGNIFNQHGMARLTRRMLLASGKPLSPAPMQEAGILPSAPEADGESGRCKPAAAS